MTFVHCKYRSVVVKWIP